VLKVWDNVSKGGKAMRSTRVNIYFTEGTFRRLKYYTQKHYGKHRALSLTVQQAVDKLLSEQLIECEQCGQTIHFGDKTGAVIHHIIPLEKGGSDDIDNLMLLCRACHNKIHDIAGIMRKGT